MSEHPDMNGAESLVRTLLAGGVDICFTNPGTSEMHFVAALDKVPGMRCVLGLFEGVLTWRRRRILPNSRQTCIHITAPWPGPRKRACQSAQRKEGKLRRRQCGRRTHHVPHQTRCAADLRIMKASPGQCPTGCAHRSAPLMSPRTVPPRSRRRRKLLGRSPP